MTGRDIAVSANKSAELGVVISALQVVQTGLLVEDVAIVTKKEVWRPPPGEGSFTLLILYPEFQKSTRGFEKAGGWGFAHPPAGSLLRIGVTGCAPFCPLLFVKVHAKRSLSSFHQKNQRLFYQL